MRISFPRSVASTSLGVMIAIALLLAGMAVVPSQPAAVGALGLKSSQSGPEGLPVPPAVVLRLPDGRAAPGEIGTYAWGDDESFVIVDAFAVVVPAEPVDVAVGALVQLDASALGAPREIDYTLYRVRQGSLEPRVPSADWRAVAPGACRLAYGEWPAEPVVPIVLDLSPGRYALEVSVWLEGGRDTHNGFYLRVTRPGADTPEATAATAPALGGTPNAAAPRVLTATAASPCLSTP